MPLFLPSWLHPCTTPITSVNVWMVRYYSATPERFANGPLILRCTSWGNPSLIELSCISAAMYLSSRIAATFFFVTCWMPRLGNLGNIFKTSKIRSLINPLSHASSSPRFLKGAFAYHYSTAIFHYLVTYSALETLSISVRKSKALSRIWDLNWHVEQFQGFITCKCTRQELILLLYYSCCNLLKGKPDTDKSVDSNLFFFGHISVIGRNVFEMTEKK